MDPAAIAAAFRDASDPHNPITGLVQLENTHMDSMGRPLTAEYTAAVAAVAHRHNVPLHIDGARLFNAAVALGVPAASLVRPLRGFRAAEAIPGGPIGQGRAPARRAIPRSCLAVRIGTGWPGRSGACPGMHRPSPSGHERCSSVVRTCGVSPSGARTACGTSSARSWPSSI